MKRERISIFHSAKLYPILDLDFCESQRISIFDLVQLWNKYPDCICFFQLRAKSLSISDYKTLYSQLLQKFPSANIIINDFWEFAIEINAFGLHIGKEDYLSFSDLDRKRLRAEGDLLKGTSSHNLMDLHNLESGLWDYSGFGPVFPTNTKKTTHPVLGIEVLLKACTETKIPLVPIGGIHLENFKSLFGFEKVLPASISMMADEKSLVKIVDFIRKHPHPV